MTAAACNLQRISRMLRHDLYFSSNGNTCYKMILPIKAIRRVENIAVLCFQLLKQVLRNGPLESKVKESAANSS